MRCNPQLPGSQVRCRLPAILKILKPRAPLDNDLLGCDADAGLMQPVLARPRPDVAIKSSVQVTQEVIRQQFVDEQLP